MSTKLYQQRQAEDDKLTAAFGVPRIGSAVTNDSEYAVVIGKPARRIGYVNLLEIN